MLNRYKNFNFNNIFLFLGINLLFYVVVFLRKLAVIQVYNFWDSGVFWFMGKQIALGSIPFVDIHDIKGIFVFLNYTLAYLISNNTFVGVFIIAVLYQIISLFFIYKIIKLFSNNTYFLYYVSLFLVLMKSFHRGNVMNSEDALIPYAFGSLYVVLNYVVNKNFKWYHFLLLGICAGYTLNLRPNVLYMYGVGAMVIAYVAIINGQYKNLFKIFILSLFGFLLIALPIVYYYYSIGHLQDYINWMFIIPSIYSNEGRWVRSFGAYLDKTFRTNTIFFIVALSTLVLNLYKKNTKLFKISFVVFLFAFLNLYIINYSLRFYGHYFYMQVPFILVFMLLFYMSLGNFGDSKRELVFKYIFYTMLMGVFLVIYYNKGEHNFVAYWLVALLVCYLFDKLSGERLNKYFLRPYLAILLLLLILIININVFRNDFLHNKAFVMPPYLHQEAYDLSDYIYKHYPNEKIAVQDYPAIFALKNPVLSLNGTVTGYTNTTSKDYTNISRFMDMLDKHSVIWIWNLEKFYNWWGGDITNVPVEILQKHCKVKLYENSKYRLCRS